MSLRVALLGGSFDPPHRGHLAMAEIARDRFALDRVLLTPAGRQPLKSAGTGASYRDRLAMTRLLCSADPAHLLASELDAPHPDGSPNYTVDTLQALALAYPGASLFAIAGIDSFLDLPRWRAHARLLELAEWIVVSRPGHTFPEPPPAWIASGRLHFICDLDQPIASRHLRDELRLGESCSSAIPAPVLAYIHEHGLYRGSVPPLDPNPPA